MSAERIKGILASKQQKKPDSNKAVIYTRVSTSKQTDNTSLDVQLERCREFCIRHNYEVIREFGGTFESAKSNEDRKEFKRMIEFVQNRSNNVRFIIVYSADRFSRTGGSAIELTRKLQVEYNISVRFINQDFDDKTTNGKFVRDLNYLLSNFDNEFRKEKVTTGMKEKLRQGYFTFNPPIGYSTSSTPGIPVPNKDAEFIKKAFELKELGYSHDIIVNLLKKEGFKINIKRLTDIFKNPFYCGYVTSSLIDGEVVKGRFEPIISEDQFLNINGAKIKYLKNNVIEAVNDFPLKGFIICSSCNKKWTGYTVKKKKINYYKCNTQGCKNNKNAKVLHDRFAAFLKNYKIPESLENPLRLQLKLVFNALNKERKNEKNSIQQRITELEDKINKVKTRYALEEIQEDVYKTALQELIGLENDLRKRLIEANIHLSNHDNFVDFAINLSRNIDQAWISGDTGTRSRLQNVIFPKGIKYDNKNDTYRTIEVNGLFDLFGCISNEYKQKEEGYMCQPSSYSDLVARTRIELVSRV